MTAIYKAPQGDLMVEVGHNGDARVSGAGPICWLITGTGDFIVFGREQLVAARLDDFRAAQASVQPGLNREMTERQLKELIELRRRFAADVAPRRRDDTPRYIPKGAAKVAGVSGTRYQISARHLRALLPEIVISSAPELRRLGEVMARFLAPPSAAASAGPSGSMDTHADVLRAGTMLKMGEVELTRLSYETVPVERFAVPAKRLRREELIVLISLTTPSSKTVK